MAGSKITIHISERQMDEIKALVSKGEARSVSDFVENALTSAINSTKSFDELLDESLARTGGPPSAEELAWVEQVLAGVEPQVRKTSRKRTAA
ncbi:hypothetical protein F183_A46420 [Bryobacterales bacterium F-183]|nr:hypothetical protein F183_A46420 [Bryobacterales bacterium F-183]